MIFIPVPEVTNEVPGFVPANDPAPQASDETPAETEEPRDESAAASTELGQAAAAAETSSGNVA